MQQPFAGENSHQRAGGRTGRKKMGVEPGFSTMNWMTLHASNSASLRPKGFRGPRSFTLREVRAHCTEEDGVWMAFRGSVYNVTPYLKFHPGGVNELMRGAGSDATRLFDEVHPWVNVEGMLRNCRIGSLVTSTRSSASSLRTPTGAAAPPPVPLFGNKQANKSSAPSASPSTSLLASPLAADFLPCKLIASRCLSSNSSDGDGGAAAGGSGGGRRKGGSAVHVLRFASSPSVSAEAAVGSSGGGGGGGEGKSEMGRFKVTLATSSSSSSSSSSASPPGGGPRYSPAWVPVGGHLRVRTIVNRQIAIREFTVVACGEGGGKSGGEGGGKEGGEEGGVWFDLLVKTYQPAGLVSSILASLALGSTQLAFKGPMGEFDYASQLQGVQCLALVAGGSGATPFYRIIERWLDETPPASASSSASSSAGRALSLVVVDRAAATPSSAASPTPSAPSSPERGEEACHTMRPAHATQYVRAARDPSAAVPRAATFLWKQAGGEAGGLPQSGKAGVGGRGRGRVDMRAVFVLTPPASLGAKAKAAAPMTAQEAQELRVSVEERTCKEQVATLRGKPLSDALLAACLPKPAAYKGKVKVLVCGPPQFNAIAARALVANGYGENQLFIFS